jgi:hypothetical protein
MMMTSFLFFCEAFSGIVITLIQKPSFRMIA